MRAELTVAGRLFLVVLTTVGDESVTGIGSYALINELLTGDPPIAAAESLADKNQVGVLPHGLTQSEAAIVGRRIRELTTRKG
jgi:hypothetical protein